MATSTIPGVKKGLRAFWRAALDAAGETKVKVTARAITPEEAAAMGEAVLLGKVTATQTWAGLGAQRKTDQATLTGHVTIVRAGSGEDDGDAARDRAFAILAIGEAALRTDPTAGGAIPSPNITAVAPNLTLEEVPVVIGDGVNGQLARLEFSITWTSRI
jgi:hypothetical protein